MKILHIDDEPDIREITALALGIDPDTELKSCPSGQAALAELAGGYKPDVILLDVMMPGLDGPGTLEQVRAMAGCAETAVIFMTARAQAQEQARFIGLGAVGVIIKPFDPMTLAAQVREILAPARVTDPLAPLRQKFRERSVHDLTTLRMLMQGDLVSNELRHLAHSLAGSAGTFGFPALSKAAVLIDDAYAAGRIPDRSAFDRLERELEAVTPSKPPN